MSLTINNYLKKLSSEYYISADSRECEAIDKSIYVLEKRLYDCFGNDILEIKPFGSYKRDTILPRQYNSSSDVDIMIIFDHNRCNVTPETYRTWLKKFAYEKYPTTSVVKDFPTVVLDMRHIKFDLIPAIETLEWSWWELEWINKIQIPNKNNKWQVTAPDEFNQILTNANIKYQSIVKPIVRLLKAWNCNNNFPYSSFELEQIIANINFNGHSYESGFFYAITQLPTNNLSAWAANKVTTLQNAAGSLKYYLTIGDTVKANLWVDKILP